MQAELIN